MPKLKLEDLQKIKEKVRRETVLREGAGKAKITVHMGTCGIAAGARKIMSVILEEIEKRDVKDIIVTTSGCAGLCSREPMITVELLGKAPVKYVDLTEDKMRRIFEEHVLNGKIVKEYMLAIGSERVD
ncbi:(2Fe-2S) ferredoxin domain-containing protein [Candidatus Aminicenantes bacterium AC-335-B20]|nr:(2Fe-2S) ferredoxin domain-containing protein [SCandidatus Aminicenantes bacterium Aminicenantia_JdfR_composite]MCP2596606.1 (2Fe-2S) ferredoxin domain-containing protein [Candidatus Aminicenantes bacterium AC-335-G13]MCP2598068.1 (2Fe-2S) ferredoxin domain-containing protein [Candidatus Aminicenantes bacterium AC-335-L06]MCP2598964.1 (2Fe-2S) ferredoxin domain-containing protein [Candidatus Aminicenantes bacterium AC-335-B20]MCP2605794.1 (2Fe-2S) ferredoxin domain-containing protein [Candid